MEIHRSDAAKMLRRVREQLNLTQKDAAAAMDISPSLLARKERGESPVERVDVRNAIEVYNLAPWEAYELWLSAGFVPEKTVAPMPVQDVAPLAKNMLGNMKYPASLLDAAGYIHAWNDPYEKIVRVRNVLANLQKKEGRSTTQVHIIDLLFSSHIRECLQDGWETFADQAIGRFYRRTLRIANEPFFPSLIERLKAQYGSELIRQWNTAQTYKPPVEGDFQEQHHIAIGYPPEFGEIRFLIMQSSFYDSPSWELNVYMPLGEDSQQCYDQLYGKFGNSTVHLL